MNDVAKRHTKRIKRRVTNARKTTQKSSHRFAEEVTAKQQPPAVRIYKIVASIDNNYSCNVKNKVIQNNAAQFQTILT